MKSVICESCGANDFAYVKQYRICKYCSSRYKLEADEIIRKDSVISLNSDIEILLDKCQKEPWNAHKYANLILDIDPTNKEAKKYLF